MTGALVFVVMVFVMGIIFMPEKHPSWFLGLEILGYVFGNILFWNDKFLRLFLSGQEMEEKVRSRAIGVFYEHRLHKTEQSTGILIMASLFEHRVHILADSGIDEKVGTEKWQQVSDILTHALKENRVSDGFCEAIAVCGDVLAYHFPASKKNPNELLDQIDI